ncbi:MAG: tRNA (cytidine(34)-2'-O)-methyltransferase [Eubacterium sp.]|nr:tRNA (cytidine(34)-2'-O)-methyltransferase [Eubacterium sp.]
MAINIVLYQPEQPGNTGTIGRTCHATGARLHLIEPLGFHLTESKLKRAGMDYWKDLDVTRYINYEEFLEKNPDAEIFYATTKGTHVYSDAVYTDNCYIMFGPESRGIPEDILSQHLDRCVRLPMAEGMRSINLANSVAVFLYEALRQTGFDGLERAGHLTR